VKEYLRKFGMYKESSGKNGTEYGVSCPFCTLRGLSPDTSFHLSINDDLGVCHCFRCGYSTTLSKMLREYDGSIYVHEKTRQQETKETSPDVAIAGFTELGKQKEGELRYAERVRNYLHIRGWTDEMIADRRVGYSFNRRLYNRVILPCFDDQNNLVYHTARSIVSGLEPKYLNPKMSKDRALYNLQAAVYLHPLVPVLVEGAFDCVFPHFVGLLGKRPSGAQLDLLVSTFPRKEFIICLDQDALRDSIWLGEQLKNRGASSVRIAECPGKDPGSSDIAQLVTQISSAKTLSRISSLRLRLSPS